MASDDLVLVTGATGFVGAAVARALQAEGFRLRLTARAGSDRRNLAGLAAEIVTADLAQPESLAPAVRGCRYVFHVAADYRLWVPNPAAMRKVNIDGSVALLKAAAAAGVERSVYTSSVAALGLTKDGTPADETTPVDPANLIGAYKRSKYDAEQAVRALAAAGQDIVIVNPSTPVGPGDVKPTPTGQMVLDAANGKMPAYVNTGLNIAHVDDVAAGHVLALRKGRPGEVYILGGEDLMLRDFLGLIASQTGRQPPKIALPIGPLMPVAWAMERLAELTGKPPLMTPEVLQMARKKMFFSPTKAVRMLGYAPRPAAVAVADALAWFSAEGMLT
ncbi:MAG: NAD-dependent dehydratase [Acidocella sp. 20-57-95]|nr:MAG: NAD-dependent dehydratase [Acidocella sp. 20-57-95]OYV61830.1 MAG: NAD-dependent dehydratase [Acidocella sp. 21-58-7]HQT62947.1 NAD-dependent epimerase/dehydratase family protein [Acidocella sp.]HQU04080.1 NAD-dependent epimerase/dehydratase family protein [Acidocella sp.]